MTGISRTRWRFARAGIWGNSLGGTLAALAAATGTFFDAVCANSGSAQPSEAGERFPRFLDKIAAMMGTADRARGTDMLARLDLSERLPDLSCPLLVLHGGNDTLFSQQNVRKIHDLAGSRDRTMLVWDDGEHCLYSYAAERNAIVAGWFRTRLEREGGLQ
ncbi:alpha/beta hydrolase family protein [Paracoccus lichenicola]|uniref:alpha/beta hydrolase family protein n=1 Tax=Paracoccus lichenicola TaxID=2665644 RepID=UPI0018A8D65D|nr:alpha/beta hydrolase [Paracoccus lichenicola]